MHDDVIAEGFGSKSVFGIQLQFFVKNDHFPFKNMPVGPKLNKITCCILSSSGATFFEMSTLVFGFIGLF